ncbi:glycerophosphodiester phosphodiesterase [Pollutibacter soli]|uniref:glycerophosphodiester phosphodiesterase n=1 Tax=Pollutibacter soli TaxID=3034157 RepID=UPI00301322DF
MRMIIFCFSFFFFWVGKNQSSSVNMQKEFDIEGHRGCRGLMPENTIAAMLHAIDIGVNTLEMDVVITKDSQVVLSHDTYMSKDISTSPEGNFLTAENEKSFNIYGMNYADLKKWDVGMKPHPGFPHQKKIRVYKPLLSEVFDSVSAYIKSNHKKPVQFNIETKTQPSKDNIGHPAPEVFVRLLMDVVKSKKMESMVIIQSFDPRTLEIIHRDHPEIKTALLVSGIKNADTPTALTQLSFKPSIFSPEYHLVNNAMVNYCHQNGIKIIPWTVNEKSEMDKLRAMGVDGLITDYPDRAMIN